MKFINRLRILRVVIKCFAVLLSLIAMSACSVIETASGHLEGSIQAGQPRKTVMNIGDLALEVWCSQAVYQPGQDPFVVGMKVTNDGDEVETLYQPDGPLAQIVIEPPTSVSLRLEAYGEESETRLDLPPGDSFEMEWNLGNRDESGSYYVRGIFWTEKRGQRETATDCMISH